MHEDPATWELIVRKLRTRDASAGCRVRPDLETYAGLAGWIESALDASGEEHPGTPALRRLNRAEYANAIRDLLDFEIDVTALLPPDDSAFGFDNIGDLLVFSPTLLERYLSAADRVSALAVGDMTTAPGAKTYTVSGDQSQATHLEGLPLGTVGGIAVTHLFPLDATYEFDLTLFRNDLEVIRGLEHPHQIEISGADLDVADPDGATALVIAIINSHYEFAEFLIESGADPNIVDSSGMGALYAAVDMHRLAIEEEAIETIRLLTERGLDLDAQDEDGNTALHAAVTGRSAEAIIRFLVNEAGADVSVRNALGQTALGAAETRRSGGEPIAALLRSLGVSDPGAAAQ